MSCIQVIKKQKTFQNKLSALSKLKSILWDLKIEGKVTSLLKKDTKQYRKKGLSAFFSVSLLTNWISLNNGQRKTRPFLIDLNSVELRYYYFRTIFMINAM